MLSALASIGTFLGLAGCASKAQDPMQQAVMTPFSDLNLVRAEIPPALLAARAQPYALDAAGSCAQWQAEIAALDAVLGAACLYAHWLYRGKRTRLVGEKKDGYILLV